MLGSILPERMADTALLLQDVVVKAVPPTHWCLSSSQHIQTATRCPRHSARAFVALRGTHCQCASQRSIETCHKASVKTGLGRLWTEAALSHGIAEAHLS